MYFSMCGPAYLLRAQCAKLESLVCALCSARLLSFSFTRVSCKYKLRMCNGRRNTQRTEWQEDIATKTVAKGARFKGEAGKVDVAKRN